MKNKTVNLKRLVEIAPDLGIEQLTSIFKEFGLELILIIKKKEKKK